MARVLVVTNTPHSPATSGYSQRVTAVIVALEARGHQIRVFSIKPSMLTQADDSDELVDPAQSEFAPIPKSRKARLLVLANLVRTPSISLAKWYSPFACDVLATLNTKWRPDVVLLESSYQVPYRSLFKCPVIFDLHNIESQLVANYAKDRRGLIGLAATAESHLLERVEASIPRRADGIATVSEADRATLSDLATANRTIESPQIVAAPNGVTNEAFEIADQVAHAAFPTAVFIGHLGWRPNIDGAKWLATEVWPLVAKALPQARLQLIGRDPDPSVTELADASTHISIHGNVPSVFPYLSQASVATAPLWTAGGTRLKILEALGTATPVISTSLGALGLEDLAAPGVLEIHDTPQAFAEALVTYLSDPAKSLAARTAAQAFRWSRTLTGLVDMVERAANG